MNRRRLQYAAVEKARQNIVHVGADNQLIDRQPHLTRRIGRKHIAKISARDGESNGYVRRA